MATINADNVRIPRGIRDAITRHEQVLVLNRERPVIAMVHPDDLPAGKNRRRGRSVRDVASALAGVPMPDQDFAADMEAVLGAVGRVPKNPWERS
jgi:hypothetical protein